MKVVKEQNLVKLENSEATAVLTSDTTIEIKGEVMIDKGECMTLLTTGCLLLQLENAHLLEQNLH